MAARPSSQSRSHCKISKHIPDSYREISAFDVAKKPKNRKAFLNSKQSYLRIVFLSCLNFRLMFRWKGFETSFVAGNEKWQGFARLFGPPSSQDFMQELIDRPNKTVESNLG